MMSESQYQDWGDESSAFENWLEAEFEHICTFSADRSVLTDGCIYFWEPTVIDYEFDKVELEYDELIEVIEKLRGKK